MAVGITERVETSCQVLWTIPYCNIFLNKDERQISSGFVHIETSQELRLVDKSFPDLVDWNYKTSQMHRRTLLKVEVKNISHLWSSSKRCRIIFRTDFPVGWANQIRMQRIRQVWFVYLRIQSLLCDDLIVKVPCTSLAQKQVESGSEVIPRCSREPSSGSAEWHENGCLGRRSVGSRQGRTYQTRKRSLVPPVYRTGQTQDVSRAG